jgi:hypothetical protein
LTHFQAQSVRLLAIELLFVNDLLGVAFNVVEEADARERFRCACGIAGSRLVEVAPPMRPATCLDDIARQVDAVKNIGGVSLEKASRRLMRRAFKCCCPYWNGTAASRST